MKTAVAALLVLTLAACSPAQQSGNTSAPAAGVAPGAAPASAASAHTPGSSATPEAAATLTRYHWQLVRATDASGQRIEPLFARPDQPLQLDFDAHGLSISNTCNRMHGSYSLAGGRLTVGNLASTLMACNDPALTALDTAVRQFLHGSLGADVGNGDTGPTLTLTTGAGDRLVFKGVATAATRYGGPGETMFLEVAPQTKPCNHPLKPGAQCLYVRELHYDAKGLRSGEPGPWHVLGQDIEGYTHQAGVRNVLRVKRYPIKNPPADAASVAYVLDMVVESHAPQH